MKFRIKSQQSLSLQEKKEVIPTAQSPFLLPALPNSAYNTETLHNCFRCFKISDENETKRSNSTHMAKFKSLHFYNLIKLNRFKHFHLRMSSLITFFNCIMEEKAAVSGA